MICGKSKLAVRTLSLALAGTLAAGSSLWAQERGWLGISVTCDCEMEETPEAFIWHFVSQPIITSLIEDGPGDEAGLRTGDVILAVNGVDITSDAGGRLFGSLRVGEGAQLTVRRASGTDTLTIVPRPREVVYGKLRAVPVQDAARDSLVIQVRELYEKQLRWQLAVREAERALRQSEGRRISSDEQRISLREQRAEIDSMNRQIGWMQSRLRQLADSLAMRTLVMVPVADSVEKPIEARGPASRSWMRTARSRRYCPASRRVCSSPRWWRRRRRTPLACVRAMWCWR